MRQSRKSPRPITEKPGAGVPFVERFVFGTFVRRLMVFKVGWEGFLDMFESISEKISYKLEHTELETLRRGKLIDRIPGLEDSSRDWSAVMTAEHLVLTMTGMRQITEQLLLGAKPHLVADTAAVKPIGKLDRLNNKELSEFFRSEYSQVLSSLRGKGPGKSGNAHPHPWFGNLRAIDWVWLIAVHQGLHYKQIKMILEETDSLETGSAVI